MLFQSDNKDCNDVNDNGNVNGSAIVNPTPTSSKKAIGKSNNTQPGKKSQPLPSPIIKSGKCLRCTMANRVEEEVISCSICNNLFHALCRDARGNNDIASISSKSFYDSFNMISNHIKPHQSRWGQFKFVCQSCCAKTNKAQKLAKNKTVKSKSCDIAIQVSPTIYSKQTQSQFSKLITNASQTLTSGNIHESSFNSVHSDVNICDLFSDVDDNTLNNTDTHTSSGCTDIIANIKTLTKLNEDVLSNIKSLQQLSNEHATSFGKKIDDISQTLKSVNCTQNLPNQSHDSPQPNDKHEPNSYFDPDQCKAYNKELHPNLLDDEHLVSLTDFLDKSNDFKTINSNKSNSSRDVIYYGEFNYKYGAIQHEANEIPNIIRPIVDKISEMYPKTIINSCLVTRYRNGTSSCPQHSDNEPFIAPWSDIFTLSIGHERSMLFNSVSNTSTEINLPNNSLLAFSRSSQEFWKHEIPCCESAAVRYSLTFRQLAPYYVNSTLIVGDSNTNNLKFGSGRSKFGVWMPGCRVKAGRINDIPDPKDLEYPYRNLIVHTGINDIRIPNHLPIPVLMGNLKDKCLALKAKFPNIKIHISMLLPTKDPGLNSMVSEFNRRIKTFANEFTNIYTISHANLADSSGMLSINLGRHNNDGRPIMFDTVHLGSRGISLFCKNIKECIVKPKVNAKTADSNVTQVLNDNKYPYWKPNPGYRPAKQPLNQHSYPWTGNHDGNFPVLNFQPFHMSNLHNGYQSHT